MKSWSVDRLTARSAVVPFAIAILALAPGAAGADKQDQVNGAGQRLNLAGVAIQFQVNARSGPAGEDARGSYWVRRETDLGTTGHRGRVICVTVVGNRAAARAIVEESTTPENPVGSQFQIQVTDNGSPGKLKDTNINFFGFDPEETGCPIIPFPEVPITAGNFVVHDATD